MEYKIISTKEFQENFFRKKADFISVLDYNQASIYKITDSEFLVKPQNPFSNALLCNSFTQVKQFEKEKWFPDGDEQDGLFVRNKMFFENLDFMSSKELKKNELLEYLMKSKSKYAESISLGNMDSVYLFLKKTKNIKRFDLHFTLLVGDFLIDQNKEKDLKWGIVEERFYLNPARQIVLVCEKDGNKYFSLEDSIFNKWGYTSVHALNYRLNRFTYHTDPPFKDFYKMF